MAATHGLTSDRQQHEIEKMDCVMEVREELEEEKIR